jgi:hypothetical protein
MFSIGNISSIFSEAAMLVQVGMNGYDFEYPTDVHECGPSGPCLIEDALSHARCHYLAGVDVLWIWSNFRIGLEQMINMGYWRSRDAAEFYNFLKRLVVKQYAVPLVMPELIAVPQ